jgi:hypothetical protein
MELMVWVTAQVLAQDASLTFCAGLRLIEAARNSVLRLFPEEQQSFDTVILPRLKNVLHSRFGLTEPGQDQ